MSRVYGPILLVSAISTSLFASAPASAQEGVTEKPPEAQVIQSVERGAFIETDFGLGLMVNALEDRKYGIAPLIGVFGGYDILPILNLSVGVTGFAAPVSVDETTPRPRGDLFFVSPTLRVQFAVLTTERNFVWVRGEAGFAFALPGKIDGADYGGAGPTFGGTVGFERFTKLRHFSIGAHAGVFVVTKPAVGIGISLLPLVKYTF